MKTRNPRRIFLSAIAALSLIPAIGQAQWKDFSWDANDQSWKTLEGLFTGNTPYLRGTGPTNDNYTGWTMDFKYRYSKFSTNGEVRIPSSAILTNVVQWLGATNIFFAPYDKYFFEVVGTSPEGYIKTFCQGTFKQDYSPGSSTNIWTQMAQINMDWWSTNLALRVTSNETDIAVLKTQKLDVATWIAASNAVATNFVAADAVVSNALSSRLEATNAVLEARIAASTSTLYRIREVLVGTNLTVVTTTNGLDLTVTVSRPTNEAVWFKDTSGGSNIVFFYATNGLPTGWYY